jgi:hypothetical protein
VLATLKRRRGDKNLKIRVRAKRKRAGVFPALFILLPGLVVLRVHGGPTADLISNKPELRRNAVYVADLPGVSGVALGEGALGTQDRGKGSAKVSFEEERLSLNNGRKIVKEVTCHTVNREFLKPSWRVELDENSILKRLGVRVGVDYFAEGFVGLALRLLVVNVRHRVNKPSLSV